METQNKKSGNVARATDAGTNERYLTIKQMAALSGFSDSFFVTNASLARHGRKAASLPPLLKIGRNVRCKESEFYRWMDGGGKGEV